MGGHPHIRYPQYRALGRGAADREYLWSAGHRITAAACTAHCVDYDGAVLDTRNHSHKHFRFWMDSRQHRRLFHCPARGLSSVRTHIGSHDGPDRNGCASERTADKMHGTVVAGSLGFNGHGDVWRRGERTVAHHQLRVLTAFFEVRSIYLICTAISTVF